MSGLPVAIGLFGVVLLAGLAVVFASLFAISLRRAARRKATRGHPPTEMSDAWAESARRTSADASGGPTDDGDPD